MNFWIAWALVSYVEIEVKCGEEWEKKAEEVDERDK